jgi:CHAT domain-containing protein/tetratricopeptide (TPR) repeat protein
MDNALFLQQLRAQSLEEGRAAISAHLHELTDRDTFGNALAEEALACLYSPFLSLKLAEVLTFFGAASRHTLSHALGLKARGDALTQIRLYQAALESLDAAGEEFLSLGDEENWARSRISWLVAATSLGRVEEALRAAERAREIFGRLDKPYWVCVIEHNTAWAYRQVGRYHEAHLLYERILAIYPTIKDQSHVFVERAIAMARGSMAINLSWLGDFARAYQLQQEAIESYRSLKELDMLVNGEITLADFDHSQSYYGSALQRYYHAQDLLQAYAITSPKMEAYVKLQISILLVKLNRANEAWQIAQEAVAIYRQLDTSLDTMNALRDYATALAASDRPQEALNALAEAETLFARGGLQHHTLATRLQRAELLLQTRAFASAFQQASALRPIFQAQGLVARSARASLILVEALLRQAEDEREAEQRALLLQEAAARGKALAVQARRFHLQEEVYRCQILLGRLCELQGEETQALHRYRAAIAQIERMLNDLLYDLSPSFLSTAWTAYAEALALCLRRGQARQAFRYLERARSMALRQYLHRAHVASAEPAEQRERPLPPAEASQQQEKSVLILRTREELKIWQERYRTHSALLAQVDASVSPSLDLDTLQIELQRCEARISELFERLYMQQASVQLSPASQGRPAILQPPGVEHLQEQLRPAQVLLAYFLQKEHLSIFVLTRRQLVTHEVAGGARQLTYLLPFLHAHLQPGGWPDPQQPPRQAIRRLLHKLYDLLLAPVAHHLPDQGGQLIIVPYGPLHTLPFHALFDGERFLIERFPVSYLPASSLLTLAEPSSLASPAGTPPLVFGHAGKEHLPYALAEARTLAQMLNARCYLEAEATIARLSELAPGSPIIHLATHGHTRLDAPNFSAVSLADGRFNAIDAFNLNLQGCELVTLSGCETGRALSGGGDEQLGLGRAFLAAGAQTLVMSLWPVEDSATSLLMQHFYRQLIAGTSKVEALCLAQRALIQGSNPAYTHPYYWAAFRLVGRGDVLHTWPGR